MCAKVKGNKYFFVPWERKLQISIFSKDSDVFCLTCPPYLSLF